MHSRSAAAGGKGPSSHPALHAIGLERLIAQSASAVHSSADDPVSVIRMSVCLAYKQPSLSIVVIGDNTRLAFLR